MTGAELAEALGLSESTVSRLASGDRRPSIDTMFEVQRVLDWPIEQQLDLLRDGRRAYGCEFKQRMEREPHVCARP